MMTFKEHILEKLKVTKSNVFVTPTYQEYYDLLDRYCKATGEKFLDLNIVFDFDDDNLAKVIETPVAEEHKEEANTALESCPTGAIEEE